MGEITWGVEAIMLSAGTNVDWLRDDLGVISTSAESHEVAAMCDDTDGVVYVPALLGLGTPKWDYGARGTLLGITRGTGRPHVVRAVLEGVAHRGADLIDAARTDSGVDIHTVRVDGGMSANPTFTQALADAANCPIEVSPVTDSTTIGAAFMAGLGVGRVRQHRRPRRSVETGPCGRTAQPVDARSLRSRWSEALDRCRQLAQRSVSVGVLSDHPMTDPVALELLERPPSGKAVVRMTSKGPSPVDLDSAAPATSRRSLIGVLERSRHRQRCRSSRSPVPPALLLRRAPPTPTRHCCQAGDGLRTRRERPVRGIPCDAGLSDVAGELAAVFAENHVTYADEIAGIAGFSADSMNEDVFRQFRAAFATDDADAVYRGCDHAREHFSRHPLVPAAPTTCRSMPARSPPQSFRSKPAWPRCSSISLDPQANLDDVFEPVAEPLDTHRGHIVMNRDITSSAASRYGRRDALKLGGLSLSLAAVAAACGTDRTGDNAPGRVGYAPPVTDPPDYQVDDAVLLRTASSLEYTAIAVYSAVLDSGLLDSSLVPLVERLIEDHQMVADQMGELTESLDGVAWNCTNPWYMERTIEPLLAAAVASDDPVRDIVNTAFMLENVASATHQTLAVQLEDAAASSATMAASTLEARHSAWIMSTARGAPGYVSPLLDGLGEPEVAPDGVPYKFAIFARFGTTGQFELVAGAPNDLGVRQTFIIQTPSLNSFIYNELEPTC